MKTSLLALAVLGSAALGACTNANDEPMMPPPPAGVGAIAGTVAADRNGDGVVDGYYNSNGVYTAFQAPPCPPAPVAQPTYNPAPMPSGERG